MASSRNLAFLFKTDTALSSMAPCFAVPGRRLWLCCSLRALSACLSALRPGLGREGGRAHGPPFVAYGLLSIPACLLWLRRRGGGCTAAISANKMHALKYSTPRVRVDVRIVTAEQKIVPMPMHYHCLNRSATQTAMVAMLPMIYQVSLSNLKAVNKSLQRILCLMGHDLVRAQACRTQAPNQGRSVCRPPDDCFAPLSPPPSFTRCKEGAFCPHCPNTFLEQTLLTE